MSPAAPRFFNSVAMELACTRPSCPRPVNHFSDLDDGKTLRSVSQKFCTTCGMPLILGGRYLPERLLGKGGFGTAFLARDRFTPNLRQCVVKQFQPSGDLSPQQIELAQSLFEREAAVLEDLGNRHPQIPNLYAFFPLIVPGRSPNHQEEFFYLVQEFIDGEDLERTLARQGKFPQSEVLEILVSMLKVLKFVHDNGTIHRDIKPSNIMRHRNGTLYLLDFGAVKQVTTAQGNAGQSTGIYSMGFAPPEQMAGGAVYPSTDLYALAVTCITLLTGKAVSDLYDAYNNGWNWQAHAQLNPAIAAVIDRMLLPTPNQRYASADDVIAALKAAVNGSSAPASSTTAMQAAPAPQQTQAPAPASPSSVKPSAARTPAAKAQAAKAPAAPVKAPAPQAAIATQTSISAIPLSTFLGGAAFTGFQGGLLAIALASVLGTTLLGSGAWLFLVVGLVLLQVRRVIERFDLVIIALVTLGVVLLFPPLQTVLASTAPRQTIIVLAILAGLVTVAIATLFRLIYRLLSSLM